MLLYMAVMARAEPVSPSDQDESVDQRPCGAPIPADAARDDKPDREADGEPDRGADGEPDREADGEPDGQTDGESGSSTEHTEMQRAVLHDLVLRAIL